LTSEEKPDLCVHKVEETNSDITEIVPQVLCVFACESKDWASPIDCGCVSRLVTWRKRATWIFLPIAEGVLCGIHNRWKLVRIWIIVKIAGV